MGAWASVGGRNSGLAKKNSVRDLSLAHFKRISEDELLPDVLVPNGAASVPMMDFFLVENAILADSKGCANPLRRARIATIANATRHCFYRVELASRASH